MFTRSFSALRKAGQATSSAYSPSVALAAVAAAAATAGAATAVCSDDCIEAPHYKGWPHSGAFSSYDHRALRRGFQVYKEVCSTCHSIDQIAFHSMVGVTHEKAELKALVKEDYEVEDGPDDEGEMFDRPAKLTDMYPGPYKNDAAGRAANNGALPPDLSLMVKARHAGIDYVFALLTGYKEEPPIGRTLMPGLHYNPYFTGGGIGMPPPLMDGQVEYPDGTPATVSQMAKDVSQFLAWCAEPELNERKFMGCKVLFVIAVMAGMSAYYKRFRWAPIKTRKITFVDRPKP